MRPLATKPFILTMPCMYQSLVVSLFPAWCLTQKIPNAIDFSIGYFGHMTKYACVLHKYPHGFAFAMINKAFFMINRAFHHMALFTFHSNIWVLHLQPIRFLQTSQHEYSTHGYQEGFFSLLEENLSIVIKTSNRQD